MNDRTDTNGTKFPDPADLTPEEMIAKINGYRERLLKDRASVTDEELAYSVRLLREHRASSVAAAGKKKKAPVVPTALSEF
ncbi:MAG: hypothetical protein ACE5HV_00005 [Acidobacteriota bacterium]